MSNNNSNRDAAVPDPSAGKLLDPVEQQLKTVASRAEWSHQQLSALVKDLGGMQRSLEQAREQSSRLFAANRALGERVRALGQELTEARTAVATQQQTNVELHDIASQLADSHSALESELGSTRAENQQLRQAIEQLQAADGDVSPSSSALPLPLPAPAAPDTASATSSGRTQTTHAMMLKAELAQRDKHIAFLEEQLTRAADERVNSAPLQLRVHQLGAERAPRPGASNATEVARLRSVVADLEAALDDAEAENARLKRTIAARDEELAWVENKAMPVSNSEVEQLRETVETQKKEITRLRTKLLIR